MKASRLLLLLIVFLQASEAMHAQKQNAVWYFGKGAGLDFNTTPPTPLTDGKLMSVEGCASVSDPLTGELLFYTDGSTVWNRRHAVMNNGTGLNGGPSATQSAQIVPMPCNPGVYYLFTIAAWEGDAYLEEGVQYSVVDMNLDGGLGGVKAKNIPLLFPSTERIISIPHTDGRSVWVVIPKYGTDEIHAFLLNGAGVSPPAVVSRVAPGSSGAYSTLAGYLAASPDGNRLAMTTNKGLYLYSFDRSTGSCSAPMPIVSDYTYGVCFSPDNSKLYGTTFAGRFRLLQFDLSSGVPETIVASRTLIHEADAPAGMQLGPDGRIYCARPDQPWLGVITRPNAAGTACGYTHDGIGLGGKKSDHGLPNRVESILTGGSFAIHIEPDDPAGICIGDSVRLGASGAVSYQWSPAEGLSCTDCPDPIARPSATTTYTVVGGMGECRGSGSITVEVRSPPVVSAGRDTSICADGSVQLRASGADSYHWSPSTGLSCHHCPDPVARPFATTTYIVVGSVGTCTRVDSITVAVRPPPVISIIGDSVICAGAGTQLTASGAASWRWSPSQGLSCADCPDPIARPSVTTTYTVTGSTDGCDGMRSITVEVRPLPVISTGRDVVVCLGERTQLTAAGAEDYRWSPSEGLSCTDCPNPMARPSATTTYTVVGRVGGCEGIGSTTVEVRVPPMVSTGLDVSVCAGESTQLKASGADSYSWSPSEGLSCTDCPDPVARPLTTTTYTVIGRAGPCRGNGTVTVDVRPLPAVSAGRDTMICPGAAARLSASGDGDMVWSPAEGLSCPTCRETEAHPSVSTEYIVTMTSVDGCIGRDTVRVDLADSRDTIATVSIGRDFRVAPADAVIIPIMLEGDRLPPDADRVEIRLSYDNRFLQLLGADRKTTLLADWSRIDELNDMKNGTYTATFDAPSGSRLQGSGTLLNLSMRGFIGPAYISEIPLEVILHGLKCGRVAVAPGRIVVDSICGLTIRLIELLPEDFVLDKITPNPFNPTTEISFSLGLDGPVRLEILDSRGNLVDLLVDEMMSPGRYAVTWNGADRPSGLYYCRLRSGIWSARTPMMLMK